MNSRNASGWSRSNSRCGLTPTARCGYRHRKSVSRPIQLAACSVRVTVVIGNPAHRENRSVNSIDSTAVWWFAQITNGRDFNGSSTAGSISRKCRT